eukprot:gene27608-7245_t
MHGLQLAIGPQLPPNLHGACCFANGLSGHSCPQFAGACNWLSGHSYPNLHGAIGYQATAAPICTATDTPIAGAIGIRPQLPTNLHGCNWLSGHKLPNCTVSNWLSGQRLPQLHGVCNWHQATATPILHGLAVFAIVAIGYQARCPTCPGNWGLQAHAHQFEVQLAIRPTATQFDTVFLQLAIRHSCPNLRCNGYQAQATPICPVFAAIAIRPKMPPILHGLQLAISGHSTLICTLQLAIRPPATPDFTVFAMAYQGHSTHILHGACNWLSRPQLPSQFARALAIRPTATPICHGDNWLQATATPICMVHAIGYQGPATPIARWCKLAIRPTATPNLHGAIGYQATATPLHGAIGLSGHSAPICTVFCNWLSDTATQLHGLCKLAIRPQLPQFARCKLAIRPQLPQLHAAIGYQATAAPSCTVAMAIRPQLPQLHGAMVTGNAYPNSRCNGYQATAAPICTFASGSIRPKMPQLHGGVQLAIRATDYPNLHGLCNAIGYSGKLPQCLARAIGYQGHQIPQFARPQLPNLNGANWLSGPQYPNLHRLQLAIRPQATPFERFAFCNWLSGHRCPIARAIGYQPQLPMCTVANWHQATATPIAGAWQWAIGHSYPNCTVFCACQLAIRPQLPNLHVCQLASGHSCPQFARVMCNGYTGHRPKLPQFATVAIWLLSGHSYPNLHGAFGYQATAYPNLHGVFVCNWLSGQATPLGTVAIGYQATELPQFAQVQWLSGHSAPICSLQLAIRPQRHNLHGAIGFSHSYPNLHGCMQLLSGHSSPIAGLQLAIRATAAPIARLQLAIRPQLPQFATATATPICTVQLAIRTTAAPFGRVCNGLAGQSTPICTVQIGYRPQLPQLHGFAIGYQATDQHPQFARCNAISHNAPNLHGAIGYQATAAPICTVQLAIRPQLPQFARCNWLSGHSCPNLHGAIGYQATATPICTVQLAIRPQLPQLPRCMLWQLAIRPQLPPICIVQLAIRPQLPPICNVDNWLSGPRTQFGTVQLAIRPQLPQLQVCSLQLAIRPQLPQFCTVLNWISGKRPIGTVQLGYQATSYPNCTVQLVIQATANPICTVAIGYRPQLPQFEWFCNWLSGPATPNLTFVQLAIRPQDPNFARLQLAIKGPQIPQFARCNWDYQATAAPNLNGLQWRYRPQLPNLHGFAMASGQSCLNCK